MILASLPPSGLTFAPRGSVRKSFTKWSSLSICYSYKSKNGLGLRQGIQDFSPLLCQIQLCPCSGEIQIPAGSTAMKRLLCYSLILTTFSQAFVQKGRSYSKDLIWGEKDENLIFNIWNSRSSIRYRCAFV